MVEVTISLTVLCGGSREGSLLSLWVFVGGFHSIWTCWPSPHSPCNHTQSYLLLWGCYVIFEPPLGHCISFSTWSWAHFMLLVYAQLVMVAITPRGFL
jgi:hypothetical protein